MKRKTPGLAQPIFALGGKRHWTFSVAIPKDVCTGLSPKERLTAWYVAQGLTNEEVAARRGVAPRTVANQVASILRRLAVQSRWDIGRVLFRAPADTAAPADNVKAQDHSARVEKAK